MPLTDMVISLLKVDHRGYRPPSNQLIPKGEQYNFNPLRWGPGSFQWVFFPDALGFVITRALRDIRPEIAGYSSECREVHTASTRSGMGSCTSEVVARDTASSLIRERLWGVWDGHCDLVSSKAAQR